MYINADLVVNKPKFALQSIKIINIYLKVNYINHNKIKIVYKLCSYNLFPRNF